MKQILISLISSIIGAILFIEISFDLFCIEEIWIIPLMISGGLGAIIFWKLSEYLIKRLKFKN